MEVPALSDGGGAGTGFLLRDLARTSTGLHVHMCMCGARAHVHTWDTLM